MMIHGIFSSFHPGLGKGIVSGRLCSHHLRQTSIGSLPRDQSRILQEVALPDLVQFHEHLEERDRRHSTGPFPTRGELLEDTIIEPRDVEEGQ